MNAAVESLRPALTQTLAALAVAATDAQIDALLAYLALLQRWNATYNLTAVRDPRQMLTQHLADCLAVVNPLRQQIGHGAARVLDVGSGGGLPGVVLAIMCPELAVTCVDTVGKKAAFVRQVSAELGLRSLNGVHERVERMGRASFDVIASRAFASLVDFTAMTERLLANPGIWVAMKGKHPTSELAALPTTVQVFHVEPIVVPGLNAERCLVWMRRSG